MERSSLSSLLRSLGALLRGATLVLLFACAALTQHAHAQNQWCNDVHVNGTFTANGFGIIGTQGGPAGLGFKYQCVGAHQTWGQYYGGPETYYTIPGGSGQQEFMVQVRYDARQGAYVSEPWYLYVDGQLCTSCTGRTMEVIQSTSYDQEGTTRYYNDALVRVRHTLDSNWPSGIREFGLGVNDSQNNGTVFENTQIRFKAVMVGTQFTDLLGYYNSPALPLFILRDPPGGESYAAMSTGSTTCSGFTQSVTASTSENSFVRAKIGFAGSIGWIVDVPFEIYVEGGVDVTAEQSETSNMEYETCFEATSEYTTSPSGTPDDMFLGSAIRYAYGMAKIIERPTLNEVVADATLASEAVSVIDSYHHTESHIRQTLIPHLEADIAALTPGTSMYEDKMNELSVWQQTLALNDSIKANAPFAVTRSFSGGGAGQTFSQTTTTSVKRNIDYTVALEEGLSFEFAAYLAGSGVAMGNSIRMRNEYGSSQGASNTNTNTMSYHLSDGDVYDSHTVNVYRDEVFGSYVFVLDSANSRTSCKWEGGFPLDQPNLSVGTPGNASMVVTEAPIGSTVQFPLILCNESDTTRTYFLKLENNTNSNSAVITAFGNLPVGFGNGVDVQLAGGECINTLLTLTQPNATTLDFGNINLRLYALCEEEYPSYIRSYVTVSAFFGEGNLGSHCIPVSATGTSQGDYVNGVQLAEINNVGTGSSSGPSYTNYSASFNTPLSRNAQHLITITSGANAGDRYAAWIDYDQSGTFDADEKLGEFTNTGAGSVQTIAFTVPADATLGSAVLRVRGVKVGDGEPAALNPCFNYGAGETEDYAVVINANTPQDCAGVNNGPALPGTPCNDGNAATGNDTWNANCVCAGLPIDCAGAPGGTALPGTPCDDGLPGTGADAYNASCQCVGLAFDCLGVPGGSAILGSLCNDGNAATGNDAYNASCQCVGQSLDCIGVPGGTTLPGSPCNDGNAATTGDVYNTLCICAGILSNDCLGAPEGTAQPGTPCDDGDASTGNDVYGTDCTCAGQLIDCAGTPGGSALPGTPCDDANTLTNGDEYNSNCQCLGVLATDCAGVPGGTAQPGTACDDGDANTGNDTYDAFCNCGGQLVDCEGNVGGNTLPGMPCDDGNAATQNDGYTLGCECEGQLPTGITDASNGDFSFSVQPNPSAGLFNFNNPAQVPTVVEVRDGLGRIVRAGSIVTARAATIDLFDVAAGTYFLMAETEGNRQVIKITVQR